MAGLADIVPSGDHITPPFK